MGFGYRRQATPYGQGVDTLEQLGGMMTYCWLELASDPPLLARGVRSARAGFRVAADPRAASIGAPPLRALMLSATPAPVASVPCKGE